jgi:HAD superfamily hydrolase (TIGR01509 family)
MGHLAFQEKRTANNGGNPVNEIHAVIFDMDGVIFDTEPLHSRAWLSAMESFGICKPLAYYEEWIGIPDTELCAHLEAEFPAQAKTGEFLARKEEHFDRLIASGFAPFEGLAVLLPQLGEYFKIGMATTGHRKNMNHKLALTNLAGFFETTVCFEDVENHKPHPAPYLLAAKRLGVAPGNCVALEDSPSGVESAKAAGMLVWGIASSFAPGDLSGADQTFPTTVQACEHLIDLTVHQQAETG